MPNHEVSTCDETTISKILVVDDQATQRIKIAKSVRSLGHDARAVDSAVSAMAFLQANPVDLILLDIEMPHIDGIEMLQWLASELSLQHIPVIVISASGDKSDLVAKAIELGAEDFLPKHFALPILEARINSGLLKKRIRDQENVQMDQIDRLMRAAKLLEQKIYDPQQLRLSAIASGDSPLANFASVFSDMGQKIFDRERKLRHQAQTLRGFGMLVLAGVLFGLDAPMAKWLSQFSTSSLGMAIWVNVVVVVLTMPWAFYKRDIPKIDNYLIGYFLLWGFCTCVLGDVLLLMASEHIPASIIIIIMVTEVLMVYAYSAITKLESTSTKKMAGVGLGFVGVVLVVFAQGVDAGSTNAFWAIAVLGVPLGYAVVDIMIVVGRQVEMLPSTRLGLASVAGLFIMIPVAWYQDDFAPLSLVPGYFEIGLLFWGLLTLGSMFVFVILVSSAGSVFASQAAYVQTIAGIGISFVVLQEVLSPVIWAALGILVVGMLLVEPKREAEENLTADELELLMRGVE